MPKQDVAVELYYDGAWHDLVTDADVLIDQPITITRGQGAESQAPRPAQVNMRLDNTDDMYRTTNPESPLYGKAGVNTPVRVSVAGQIRGVAQASSWTADQSSDFRRYPRRGKSWVDLEAAGLLLGVNERTEPLRSSLYRAVKFNDDPPAEWWPMEDPSSSTAAVSANGGSPLTPVTTVRYTLPSGELVPPGGAPQFGSGTGILGSAPLVSFQGGGTLQGPVRTATFDGYAIDWVMQFQAGTDEGGTTSADVLRWQENGTYVTFTVNVTLGSVTVFHANAADAATLTSTGSAALSVDPYDGTAHHYRYQVRQDGADYSATLYIDSSYFAVAENFATPGAMAGTVGQPTAVEWNPLEDRGDYMPVAVGHTIIWASGQLGDQPALVNYLDGKAGELTSYRLSRLLTEEGVTHFVSDSPDDATAMGPQRVDTLGGLLAEIVRTEDGILCDWRDDLYLQFICRRDRYVQTPALELTPTDLPVLPREVTDNLGAWNILTASQREGGDVTVRDDTGPSGTQAPPDGRGEKLQTVAVNVADETAQLPRHAYWWLNRGTVDLPRFPRVTVDLTDLHSSKITEVEAVDVGSVITITGYREYTIRLFVLGYTETIGTHTRTIVFTCAPDRQFDVALYAAAGATPTAAMKRYESATTTLAEDITTTETLWDITTTNENQVWSTTAEPYDWLVNGERVTVTSMTAAAGSGPYTQTATVARSVNGIVKTHSTGDAIGMHPDQQARYAL